MTESSRTVLALVRRAHRRLLVRALADAVTAPAAGFLLVAAGTLAAARAAGLPDLPLGFLGAAGALAALAATARLVHRFPGRESAALHLDRVLGAGERFTTVLEAAGPDPAVAAWAARGILRDTGGDALRRALAVEPPAGLLPLVLAGVAAAGLVLLPGGDGPDGAGGAPAAAAAVAAAGSPSPGEGAAAPRDGAARTVLPDARTAAADAAARTVAAAPGGEDARATLEALEARARERGSKESLAALAEAREALARGDREAAAAAVRRAVEGMYGPRTPRPETAGGGPAGGGPGEAAAGEAAPGAPPATRRLPVPLRAREAVRRYFGDREGRE